MAARPKVVVTGLKAVDRRLRTLPIKVQKRVVRQSMRAGLRMMAKSVKGETPVLTGATRLAVKVRAVARRKRDVIEYEVRVLAEGSLKKTSAKTGKTVFYPAIVEYKFDPFMARAFARDGDAARDATIRALKAGLDREIASK